MYYGRVCLNPFISLCDRDLSLIAVCFGPLDISLSSSACSCSFVERHWHSLKSTRSKRSVLSSSKSDRGSDRSCPSRDGIFIIQVDHRGDLNFPEIARRRNKMQFAETMSPIKVPCPLSMSPPKSICVGLLASTPVETQVRWEPDTSPERAPFPGDAFRRRPQAWNGKPLLIPRFERYAVVCAAYGRPRTLGTVWLSR